MHKFMDMKPVRAPKKKQNLEDEATGLDGESDGDQEDPEMEAFATAEMDKQMRRMANGAPGGMPDSEEEDPDLDDLSIDE